MSTIYALLRILIDLFFSKPIEIVKNTNKIQDMLLFHNQYRLKHSMSELTIDSDCSASALEHCKLMCEKDKLSHRDFNKRVKNIGIVGENVGYGPNAQQVFNYWIKKTNNRYNILNNVSTVGIGEYNGYWVVVFKP